MTKVDIFSGFLGAGKTTLIKKLIEEAYKGEKVVLIENEFGDIGIDGGFLKDSGVQINEMNSGCICCSLVGDFAVALEQVINDFAPDRIIIEPSGVGKLSDVILAVENLHNENIALNGFTTVVDAKKAKMYMKNFGEFFNNQIENASAIVLSHTSGLSQDKLDACVAMLREHNKDAEIVTTEWDELTGKQILETMEQKRGISAELAKLAREMEEEHDHHHHNHDHDDDDDHDHEHHDHHHDDDGEHDHEHHDHHHDDEGEHDHEHHDHHHDDDGEHDHEHHDHHHDDDGEHDHDHCDHDHGHCEHEHHHEHDQHHHHHHDQHHHHHHDHNHHHHHHHHHADEVFQSVGIETSHKFTEEQIEGALNQLSDFTTYGQVLRAKGIVEAESGKWIHFDYVPGEVDVREGSAATTGMICVIGAGLEEDAVKELFGV